MQVAIVSPPALFSLGPVLVVWMSADRDFTQLQDNLGEKYLLIKKHLYLNAKILS